jgi:hypothetical protein
LTNLVLSQHLIRGLRVNVLAFVGHGVAHVFSCERVENVVASRVIGEEGSNVVYAAIV